MNLTKRVEALEDRLGTDRRPWHHIVISGQSEEEAIAAYEAEHGSVEGDNLILVMFVDPPSSEGLCRWARWHRSVGGLRPWKLTAAGTGLLT